jgi:hypothetical protein
MKDKTMDRHQKDFAAYLRSLGFSVGPRNPAMNTNYTGAFMVSEPMDDPNHTQVDGSGGVWCIVGPDLAVLLHQTESCGITELYTMTAKE